MNSYLDISPAVKSAMANKVPVVALESTIISHGMPYPRNVETAMNAEQIIRDNGCEPATIAIINGKLKVGLTSEEIDFLGKEGLKVIKTSRRDIPYIVSQKLNGATTVSATMIIAEMAGIKVFATGGVGGVHRGAESTFDISTDLEELAHTNVAVVCAGAKSILDLAKTLEYLETKGVPVLGYQTNIFPAFFTSQSPFKVTHKMDSAKEIANFIKVKWEMNLNGGVLVANPIPVADEMDADVIEKAIQDAIVEMDNLNIKGKETTPYLLAKITEITGGKSLDSNIKLVYNNCRLASQIAKAL